MLPLSEIYRNSIADEKVALDRINFPGTPEIQVKSDEGMLWYYNENMALGEFFINGNVISCKQHFYRCARIDEYLINNYDSRILDSGINHITYALLSDNTELIARYADLSHSVYKWMVEHGYSTLLYCIQQIMKDNWEGVKRSIEIMNTKNAKLRKGILSDISFFEALLEKNESKMFECINQLLKDHKKRNKYLGISEQYISIPALTYTKLAWLKGFELQIDHPLIPKELLPYCPLEKYDDKYDFLAKDTFF
ncbi:Imm49 family immunity protein [Pedobacter sp. BG31]|uniref:Imm49 family immunity protein n=1 Tax=Pedobacter sp. BG31 TaxID=3349697 RepID=UPI0035F33594